MRLIFILFLWSILTACGSSRTAQSVKINRTIIERIDTTVVINPVGLLATFDSITSTRQTISTDNGSVSVGLLPSGKIEVICITDTVFVPVQMERTTTERIKKKDTQVKNKGVRWRWFIFGIVAAIVGRLLLMSFLGRIQA